MTPLDPTEPLEVTLQAAQWNQVLALLGDVPAPHRVTDPLIRTIADQLVRIQQSLDDNVIPMGQGA